MVNVEPILHHLVVGAGQTKMIGAVNGRGRRAMQGTAKILSDEVEEILLTLDSGTTHAVIQAGYVVNRTLDRIVEMLSEGEESDTNPEPLGSKPTKEQ